MVLNKIIQSLSVIKNKIILQNMQDKQQVTKHTINNQSMYKKVRQIQVRVRNIQSIC